MTGTRSDNYYQGFPRDPVHIKVLVYSIWLIETLHIVLVTRDIFALLITGFGKFDVLNDLHLLPFTIGILGGLSKCIRASSPVIIYSYFLADF